MANIEFQGVSPAVLARDYVSLVSAQTPTDGGTQARANIAAIDKPTAQGLALVNALIFGS